VSDTYRAACFLARCVPLAEKDRQLDEAQRKKLVHQYGDRAMKLLRQAVQNGFQDVQQLKTATVLAPLRPRADFQQLVSELEKHSGLGSVLHDKKQYDAAIAKYKEAIRLDPNDAKPHNGLGNVLSDK